MTAHFIHGYMTSEWHMNAYNGKALFVTLEKCLFYSSLPYAERMKMEDDSFLVIVLYGNLLASKLYRRESVKHNCENQHGQASLWVIVIS